MPYISHLSRDRKLKKLIDKGAKHKLKKRKDICTYLCASIMSQQLSTKVAEVIYNRFLVLFDNDPSPQRILDMPHEKLRAIGLSNAKASYVKNVAAFELEHGMDVRKLSKMTNEEVIDYLVAIKGVGRWTVEMLLMFALGREDVFAVDDLGIQNAMVKLYGINNKDRKALKNKMIEISSNWAPYRTYACLHLWRWKDEGEEKAGSDKPKAKSGKRKSDSRKK